MTMVSYADNWEDVVLDRVFPRAQPGFYVDVGAGDPIEGSVTKHFYDLGWRGVNVEPAPAPFARLARHRVGDRNLNVAVSDREGKVELHGREVPVMTLAAICEEHVKGALDILVINAGGDADKVVAGADLRRWRPRIVLVREPDRHHVDVLSDPADDRVGDTLAEAKYLPAAIDGATRFYVRREDAGLMSTISAPVTARDDFVPYAHAKRVDELTGEVASVQRAYRELESALSDAQTAGMALRAALAESASCYEQLRHEIVDARAITQGAGDALNDIGPTSLGLARRLSGVSRRFPRAAGVATSCLRTLVRLGRTLRDDASRSHARRG